MAICKIDCVIAIALYYCCIVLLLYTMYNVRYIAKLFNQHIGKITKQMAASNMKARKEQIGKQKVINCIELKLSKQIPC